MSVLDNPITVRDLLQTPLAFPTIEMTWEEYLAIPAGLHVSRDYNNEGTGNGGSRYRFAAKDLVAGYAVACVATLLRVIQNDDGGTAHYEHRAVTVNGGVVILRSVSWSEYKVLDPFGTANIVYAN